ncbi:EpsG family protein [Qipengyuania gaetbuli]|uniref:EpsG family protein n=1 Tax=Qipengyuania gaetbuli TaxID=266952 RepID=UPI001C993E24|nr:EpsG family protein [Qipengyuania gaetbuli]MBY6016077.1 EpsG family protein [Qipengyuania gaetbuli]
MIYVAVFGAMILLRWALEGNAELRRGFYWALLFALFLFSAFRFEVGCDWTGYLNQYFVYRSRSPDELLDESEPLWVGLFMLLRSLGLSYPWINVLSSGVFFLGIHALCRRQIDPLACLIFLFPILYINMPMSGIRQGAAIGIMCLAYCAFSDRAPARFIAWVLVASAIHSSALVFLLLAPLVEGNYSRSRLFLAALLAVPGGLALMSTESAQVADSRYIDTGIDAVGAIFRVGALALSAAYFFIVLEKKWMKRFPGDFKLAAIGALMMVATLAVLPVSSVIADRVAYYLIPIQAAIFARIPFFSWRVDRELHTAFPYALLFALFVAWTMLGSHFEQCYIPYQSWLLGFPEGTRLSAP